MRIRPYAVLVLVTLIAIPAWGQANTITSNVTSRTFFIKWGRSVGAAFTIDHKSKQYLVTARHVVEGITSGQELQIFYEKQWKHFPIKVVGISSKEIDIAVLVVLRPLRQSHVLPATGDGISHGQQVFFLGFPFGREGGGEYINAGFPLPFVKAATLSAIITEKGVAKIYLDAHGNRGFSGGPVVFVPLRRSRENKFRVAGMISRLPDIPQWARTQVVDSKDNLIGYVEENPGIVVAIGIEHAIELIEANPIGFPLSAEDMKGEI